MKFFEALKYIVIVFLVYLGISLLEIFVLRYLLDMISDDYLVAVGSANMDNMSFFLNLEVDALVYDEEFAVSSRELYISETKDKCLEITLDEVRRWNIFRRMRNWLARVAVGNIT